MLWLDGSSSLPFPIISAPLLSKYCLEDLAETLAELENQAKIVKSCGNFDHWCIAASELVDLANLTVWKDNSFLYWDGLISKSERLRRCSQVSSQLVDSVSFRRCKSVDGRALPRTPNHTPAASKRVLDDAPTDTDGPHHAKRQRGHCPHPRSASDDMHLPGPTPTLPRMPQWATPALTPRSDGADGPHRVKR